jgi:uroporphyrinogen-III synthase
MEKLLITKFEEDREKISNLLKENHLEIFHERVFSINKNLQKEDFANLNLDKAAIILTSSNAQNKILAQNFDKNILILAISEKTIDQLKKNGFKNFLLSKERNAKSLKELIVKKLPKNSQIFYFRSSIISLDFKVELNELGFKNFAEILAYQIIDNKSFSKDFLNFAQKNKFKYITFFSKNSAKIFFNLVKKHNLIDYFSSSEILAFSEEIYAEILNLEKIFGFKLGNKKFKDFGKLENLKKYYE